MTWSDGEQAEFAKTMRVTHRAVRYGAVACVGFVGGALFVINAWLLMHRERRQWLEAAREMR